MRKNFVYVLPGYWPPDIEDWTCGGNSSAPTAEAAEAQWRTSIVDAETHFGVVSQPTEIQVKPFTVKSDPEIRWAIYWRHPCVAT
jgi:hypothetical protein